jgi:hypothetical protein
MGAITDVFRGGVVIVTLLYAFNPVVELAGIRDKDALFTFLVCLFPLVIGDVFTSAF